MSDVIQFRQVQFLPNELEQGILYVSEEYAVAGHLCPCGCGNKVITPLGPNEWRFWERDGQATLRPSLGNWQLPCRSHYWISGGEIEWSYQWSDAQIVAGRKAEEQTRKEYFKARQKNRSFLSRLRASSVARSKVTVN